MCLGGEGHFRLRLFVVSLMVSGSLFGWELGEKKKLWVAAVSDAEPNSNRSSVLLAEIQLEAQDAFPWMVRTTTLHHLIQYRLFLKSLLISMGAENRDFRLPISVSADYPAEEDPEIDAYAQELARVETPEDESPIWEKRYLWLLLGHSWRISHAPTSERAKMVALAPRILGINSLYEHLTKEVLHSHALPQINQVEKFIYTTEIPELPDEVYSLALPVVRDALLHALNSNTQAIEMLALAKSESELDALALSPQLISLTLEENVDPTLQSSAKDWLKRVQKRRSKDQKALLLSAGTSAGLLLITGLTPYVGIPLGVAKITSAAGAILGAAPSWFYYWKMHTYWNLQQSTFAGSDLLLSYQDYVEARGAFGEATMTALMSSIFFVPSLGSWGRVQALVRSGPAGMSRILSELDRLPGWRGQIAKRLIAGIENRLAKQVAKDVINREPVIWNGLRYKFESTVEPALQIASRSNPFQAIKAALTNPTNISRAVTMISVNTIMKSAVETILRHGDIWEDQKWFGVIPKPKTGILINITTGNIILGTMAFVSNVKHPLVKLIPPMIATGAASAASLQYYTGHIDWKRVASEMGFNAFCTRFILNQQIGIAEYLRSIGGTPEISFLAYRTSFATSNYLISGFHSWSVKRWFEDRGKKTDSFHNLYRDPKDASVYRLPKGAYAKKIAPVAVKGLPAF